MRSTFRSLTLSLCATLFAGSSVSSFTAVWAQDANVAPAVHNVMSAPAKGIVTLDPLTVEELAARSFAANGKTSRTPENFRQFDAVSKGQIGDTQTLTLRFAASAKLMTIKSTPEFKVEQGGSCVEGFSYAANSTCTLLVRSTPQGPGNRLGKLTITNSAEVKPLYVGLGGYGYAPTISFTPSIITTVPGTYPSGKGLLSGATNLAVDGGDSLYMADTGNNVVRFVDSSGTLQTITSGFTTQDPVGITVDSSGSVFFSQDTPAAVQVISLGGSATYYQSGSTGCAIGSTCGLAGSPMYTNGAMATDPGGNVFLESYLSAAKLLPTSSGFDSYVSLIDYGAYNSAQYNSPQPLAVDANDSIYAYRNSSGNCFLSFETYYQASNGIDSPTTITGGRTCGFAGDGGQARGAEIGTSVGQMTFDIAGNFYFSDTSNQRVRRIDASTGIITTIAGNGSVGYGGDNGPATSASLNTPTGVAVDSQGQVYILSNLATTGTAQVVRKVGVVGALNLGGLAVGTPSTAQTVTLANTGNSQLDFTHVGFSSGNTSDFVIDPNTTSCNFTVALAAGRSCKIGFIFTPSATGSRSAVLSITDDTIAGINTIQLSGTGYTTATLTPASLSFASTNVGSATAAQLATLTNTGKAVMTINSILISGTGATSYTDTTTCGTTLAVGASCTISVTFKPAAVGSLPATLTVTDNAITGKQTVALTGTGVGVAEAALSPASLTFASTKVGSTSAAQTVTLSNPGTAALTITSISMTGTNAADYPLTKTCGTSLAVGASCTISVSFKPTATGTRTATVSAATSAGTVTDAVSGTAVAAAVVKSSVTLSSAANPLPMFHPLVLTVTVTGSSAGAPTGTVRLMEGSKMWTQGVLAGGTVSMKAQGLSSGTHKLTASYLGDSRNSAATSAAMLQVVLSAFQSGPRVRVSEPLARSDF